MTQATDAPSITTRFIEPLDILFFRGNQLFGEAGSFGESMMPPWPSVVAGAIRSRILADEKIDLEAFAKGNVHHPSLGTPTSPGPFMIHAFHLARHNGDPGKAEMLYSLPADLSVSVPETGADQPDSDIPVIYRIRPTQLHPSITTSTPLSTLPILAQSRRSKPAANWWLRELGWKKYLQGETPLPSDLIHSDELWKFDDRVAVGLDTDRRSATEGRLFTSRAIVLQQGVGFAVSVAHAKTPETGLLRLGGDGRGARLHRLSTPWPEPNYNQIAEMRRCRLVLTSPAIFSQGWLPTGTDTDYVIQLPGLRANLVSAVVNRNETVSGWDIATKRPKHAVKTVASGSVYWFDNLETTPEALRQLTRSGLWDSISSNPARQAEGFNRINFAPF